MGQVGHFRVENLGDEPRPRLHAVAAPSPVEWRTAREAAHVITHHGHPKRTILTALIVGSVLFLINQLDVVIAGNATWVTWVKSGVTYLVPLIVANIGILIATRRRGAG